MKIRRQLIEDIIAVLFFIMFMFVYIGCAPGGGGGSGGDEETDSNVLINPTGKSEASFCRLRSEVSATSVDASWNQSNYTPGEMKKNDGTYGIMGTVTGPFASFRFDGTCLSEVDNVDVDGITMSMTQPITATVHNINHMTTLQDFIAEDHFRDPGSTGYQDLVASHLLAKSEIYAFFGFPEATKNFYEMSVIGQTIADAYLLLFESAVSSGRDGPDQNYYIGVLGNAILSGNIEVRNELRQDILNLPIKKIYDNMSNEIARLGFTASPAPIWLATPEAYYEDILTRIPTFQGSYNLDATGSCSIDVSDMNLFAVPIVFESWITTSNYLALNIPGNPSVSVWSHHFDSYDRPYQKLVDLTTLREILFDDPESMAYNGQIESAITPGINLYLVFEFAENNPFTKSCTGASVPFGQILASNDGGLTWSGPNVTPYFTHFGLRLIGYD